MIHPVQHAESLAAELEETFNTLFDELDKLPKEHRAKAFDMLSNTPWFKQAEDQGNDRNNAVRSVRG
jgi:hypothetical protein